MMKDSGQKQKAIRYCVATGMVPFLEVLVRHAAEVSDTVADITDVDVLGITPAGTDKPKIVLFDCKTLAKQSGINRAFWAEGLKQFVGASEAFVILNKAAPEGHRLAANKLGVRLFSEPLFDSFASSASKDYFPDSSYLETMEAWEQIFSAGKAYPGLDGLVSYLTADAPLESNAIAGFRSLLAHLKRSEGEVDPSKPLHRCIYGMAISQALVFLSDIASTFHSVFDASASQADFEKMLRYYVWGGKESYELRSRLNLALKTAKGVNEPPSFDLPNWDQFKELMRAILDAPFSIGSACLPIKEMAFREICDRRTKPELELARRIKANNRVLQYSLIVIGYLSGLSRLTRDCYDHYRKTLGELSAISP